MKNHKTKVSVICNKTGCRFSLCAVRNPRRGCLEIRKLFPFHDHGKEGRNTCLSSKYLSIRYMDYVRDNPDMSKEKLCKHIHQDLRLMITPSKCYRAIRRALDVINGEVHKQFDRLYDYCETLEDSNPNTRTKVVTRYDGEHVKRFLRVYIRFAAQYYGFVDGCRPFVGLDGCHLKGYYGGQMLVAVGKDADDGMFPLCFAVVEAENKESWKWFLDEMFSDFKEHQPKSWVFMSDKQKGLVEAFNEIGSIEHRWCIRHMVDNFALKFKDQELEDMVWSLSKCATKEQFTVGMEKIRAINEDAYFWLAARQPDQWVKAHFSPRAQCALQVNNIAETFNSWILKGRGLSIIQLIEFIRKQLMERFYERRQMLDEYIGPICPTIQKKLEKIKEQSSYCFGRPSGFGLFEVDEGEEKFRVNLAKWTCSCKDWDLSGIPCKHAVAAIFCTNGNPEDYVHEYYFTSTFKKIYAHVFQPMGGPSDWKISQEEPMKPPIVHRAPGRPKKKRVRGKNELKNPYKAVRDVPDPRCGHCKKVGHNKRTCPELITTNSKETRKEKNKIYMRAKRAKGHVGEPSNPIVGEKKKAAEPKTQLTGPDRDRIEQNRQAALSKLAKKDKIFMPKEPFNVQQTQEISTIPTVGIADAELARLRNHTHTLINLGYSTFGDQVRVSRRPLGESNTQPELSRGESSSYPK